MGKGLLLEAYRVPGLTPAERVVLMRMAYMAKDHDSPPVYFAGWQPLALALGKREDESGRNAVHRIMASLVDKGRIKPTPERHGRHHVYDLTIR